GSTGGYVRPVSGMFDNEFKPVDKVDLEPDTFRRGDIVEKTVTSENGTVTGMIGLVTRVEKDRRMSDGQRVRITWQDGEGGILSSEFVNLLYPAKWTDETGVSVK